MEGADLTTTRELIARSNAGEVIARDLLAEKCLPVLTRWARGRLPKYGRDLSETDDLVQITLVRALNNLEDFEAKHPGAFLAYLRTVLLSVVKDEVRRTSRARQRIVLAESVRLRTAEGPDSIADLEDLEAFEAAVNRLPEPKRTAVILRVELGLDFESIARELECPSANAARMMVQRALAALVKELPEPEEK
ncbi:MAG: sigma-70 family RNA polymerase sigma factor [Xanthomonadales bacterium]|nr:sigma-70 family RNA polymerase sigma factor [Xanthomonadales bacterium]